LDVADPLFHLTHGFFDFTVKLPAGGRTFTVKSGKSALINPRRYGAATTADHARYKLSIFTREEASAIVAYLEAKRDGDPGSPDKPRINAALDSFWLERTRTAPAAEDLRRQLTERSEYLDAIQADARRKTAQS
jgi:hypothetical protein